MLCIIHAIATGAQHQSKEQMKRNRNGQGQQCGEGAAGKKTRLHMLLNCHAKQAAARDVSTERVADFFVRRR